MTTPSESRSLLPQEAESGPPEPDWLAVLRAQIASLRYGVVQLVIHDGRVTQIERTEKFRLPDPAARR